MVLTMITLMFAVYWGQLSGCNENIDGLVDQYSCTNTDVMKGLCAMSSLLFLTELDILFLFFADFHHLFINCLIHNIQVEREGDGGVVYEEFMDEGEEEERGRLKEGSFIIMDEGDPMLPNQETTKIPTPSSSPISNTTTTTTGTAPPPPETED